MCACVYLICVCAERILLLFFIFSTIVSLHLKANTRLQCTMVPLQSFRSLTPRGFSQTSGDAENLSIAHNYTTTYVYLYSSSQSSVRLGKRQKTINRIQVYIIIFTHILRFHDNLQNGAYIYKTTVAHSPIQKSTI